jgi:hypothetical protein
MPRYCRVVPEKHVRRRRRRKPLPFGGDLEESTVEPNSNHWLQPRVMKTVEDEYETENKDTDDNDVDQENGNQDKTTNINGTTTTTTPQKHTPTSSKEGRMTRNSTTICLHYNGILYMDFLGPEQMVVVEQPWLPIVSTFPDALQRRIYGFN